MITDGISTFAIYTYQCGLLQWSGSSNFAVVGYNAQGLAQNAPFSATPTVATQISCRCLPRSLTWYNIIYQLPFTVIPQFHLNTAECFKHYTTDIIRHPFSDFQVLIASRLVTLPSFVSSFQFPSFIHTQKRNPQTHLKLCRCILCK